MLPSTASATLVHYARRRRCPRPSRRCRRPLPPPLQFYSSIPPCPRSPTSVFATVVVFFHRSCPPRVWSICRHALSTSYRRCFFHLRQTRPLPPSREYTVIPCIHNRERRDERKRLGKMAAPTKLIKYSCYNASFALQIGYKI